MGGVAVSASILFITAIADGLSTYLFDGATLSSKINGALGGKE